LIPFIPILWLVSASVPYLISLQVFSGIVWAGFDVCSQSLIYKAVPAENRIRYMAYQGSLTTLFRAGGALLGACLLSVVFPVHGYRILGLFLISGILRFVVARAMLPRMRRLREVADLETASFLGASSPFRDSRGKWHQNELTHGAQNWHYSSFSPRLTATREDDGRAIRNPFYLRPRDWTAAFKPSKPLGTAGSNTGSPNLRKGLYYHPEDWDAFIRWQRR
jgi:MFS family permease